MPQVSSNENLKIIRGSVSDNGSIKCGPDFRVVNEETGIYDVLFNFNFLERPTVVVTQNFPSGDPFDSDGGDTRDNAIVIAVRQDRFKVKMGNSSGSASNRSFEFIAVGPV